MIAGTTEKLPEHTSSLGLLVEQWLDNLAAIMEKVGFLPGT